VKNLKIYQVRQCDGLTEVDMVVELCSFHVLNNDEYIQDKEAAVSTRVCTVVDQAPRRW